MGPARRKTSRYSLGRTPNASGFGVPLRPTRPDACRPPSSRNHAAVRPAGRICSSPRPASTPVPRHARRRRESRSPGRTSSRSAPSTRTRSCSRTRSPRPGRGAGAWAAPGPRGRTRPPPPAPAEFRSGWSRTSSFLQRLGHLGTVLAALDLFGDHPGPCLIAGRGDVRAVIGEPAAA